MKRRVFQRETDTTGEGWVLEDEPDDAVLERQLRELEADDRAAEERQRQERAASI